MVVVLPAVGVALVFCRTPRSTWRLVGRALRGVGALTGLGPEVCFAEGPELPAGGCVVVSNHASLLDVPVLIAALDEPVAFTAKRAVFGWPVVGSVARRIGAIPVERSSVRRRAEALQAADAAVRGGRTVHVFPESTFSPAAGLLPFRSGAFRLAREHALPIVPVALAGTRRCLPPGARLPRPGRIEVRVLAPIEPPREPKGFRALASFREEVRQALADAVGELVLHPARPAPREGATPSPARAEPRASS